MSRRPAASLPLLALAAVLTPAGAWAQSDIEVVSVDFEGNETFPDDSLQRAIVNRPSECRIPLPLVDKLCDLGWGFLDDDRYLNRRELPRDVARLRLYYWQRGFREARVDTSFARPSDDEIALTFMIEEGRPVLVDSLAVVGGEDVDASLLGDLPLDVGDRLSGILLDATRDTLLRRLQNNGYARADVLRNFFIPRDEPYSAEVTYDVDPGPLSRFGEIDIRWADEDHELSEEVVRRMLPFSEGDVYSRAAVFQAQRNLFSLQIVRNVLITDTLESEVDSIVPVRVTVSEGDEHRVLAGAGWSTSECLNSEGRWTSRNFLGGARRLQVRGRISRVLASSLTSACPQAGDSVYARLNGLVSVEFNQPWIFSARNALAANLYVERQSVPDVFVREAIGVGVSITRSLDVATPLTVSFRPQLSRLDAAEIFFCTSFTVCRPEDVDVLQAANWLSPVGVSLNRNRTNSLLNPTDGYQALADAEHASGWTGSNYVYTRLFAEGSWYRSLGGGSVAAGRLRLGWVGAGEFGLLSTGGIEVVHPQKRFYAGGANSVRGFPQNRLGPRVLTADVRDLLSPRGDDGELPAACSPAEIIGLTCDPEELGDGSFFPRPTGGTRVVEANAEYRFRIGGPWEGVGFVDAGQVWGEGEGLDLGEVEITPGMGVRYFSPIGPIRVDLAYRFRGEERLPVVTSQIRPYDPSMDESDDRLVIRGDTIPYVRSADLALLESGFEYGGDGSFFRRLQLHFSIGQAF